MKISARSTSAIISVILFLNALAATETKAQVLNEILRRMDVHQKSLSSLRSKIAMEKYNSQLNESELFQGTTIYTRLAKKQVFARIDWTKPMSESLSFVNGQYILYRPRLKQAIAGKLENNTEIVKALSFLNMTKKQIKASFSPIKYLGQEKVKSGTETWHLQFTSKSVIYKSAEIWIDRDGMPIQAKVFENNNDSTTVLLSDFKKNETIDVSSYQLDLPKGMKIIKTSPVNCLCFKPDNARDALKYWSDAVFSGKLIAVNGTNYTFKTERMWKGLVSPETVVRAVSTEDNCLIMLTAGERYLVFAKKINVKGNDILTLMPCNFTSSIDSVGGKKILKEIGKGKPIKKLSVKKKTSIR